MTGLGNKLLGIMNLKPASEVDTATRAMGQVEELIDVVSRAAEGDVPQEIPVSGDDAIGNLAGGLQTIFEELAAKKERLRDFEGQLSALSKSQAVIEFELDGTIIAANENFLATLGYSLEEVQGKHHRIFVDPAYANSHEYQQFWREIGSGDFKAGEFQRFAKDGRSVWIQASYNPIFDAEGKPYKVVKYASDITAAKLETTGNESQLEALRKSQAVIEFELDGTIITANENFQNAVGYNLSEIQGKHHRIFVDPTYGASAEYRQFWQDLAQGEFKAGEFERFTKDGSSVWIQASYNPIFDPNGKPYKVVKYASDITAAKVKAADHEGQLQAINKSQAVIEFDLQGNIQTANENFLATVGYSLNEIQGKHHRIFVDPTYAASPEYAQFWRELGDGEFQSGEFQRFGKGGEEVWIQASYNPIFDPNGKPYKVVKYASDITPQKTAEREMKRVQAMIKQATAMVFADADHVIRYMNPAAEKALQALEQHLPVRASEIVGQSIDIFHKDPSHQRRILGNSANLPLTTQIKVGPETLALDVKPVFDEDGNNLGTMVTWELVTEKLAMEQQIKDKAEEDRQEAERVRGQVEHILDVVQRVADGDASAEITVTGDDAIGSLADGLRKFFEEKRLADKEKQERADLERQQAETTALKVKQVLELVNAMADGRFNLQFPDLGDDAIGQVNSALEKAATSMRDALVEVREVSNTVATASNEMTSASDEITKGAQQQAARLEETAASLEEITSTVKQNSDNAQEARALATSSRDIATDGGQVVGDAVQAMREINDSSKQISDIITTIDEIAFQTNLLALNAAVEAARAGEQGRGFAVVASEVRNLAQRSASSAKEIKSLIQDSAGKVEKGTELVNKSGETLGEIVDSVKRVTDIVSEIAAASQEQLTAIEQLNQAVTQMDQVTQGNANQTEELSGTSNSVLNHAKRLDEMVSAFQLGTTGTTSHTSQTVAMPPASAPSFDEVEDDGDDFMDF